MRTLHRYTKVIPCLLLYIIGTNTSAQKLSFEKIPGNEFKPFVTEEILLLAPKLQGEFTGNYIWPAFSNNHNHEIGTCIDGSAISNLALWGNAAFTNRTTGLLLTGFSSEKSELPETIGNGKESEKFNTEFSIHTRTFLEPFLPGFIDGISAEYYYSKSKEKLIYDTLKDSSGTDFFCIHTRAVHQLKRRFVLYADGWFDEKDSIVPPKYIDTYDFPSWQESIIRNYHCGVIAGLFKVVPQRLVWRISWLYEYFHAQSPGSLMRTNRLGFDGAFVGVKHFGPLIQYTGIQARVYLLSGPRVFYKWPENLYTGLGEHFGCTMTIPLLLQYSPISQITFSSSCKVTVDIKHFIATELINPGNQITSAIEFSPLSVQWTPSKNHSITLIPRFLSSGIINAFLEWRFNF